MKTCPRCNRTYSDSENFCEADSTQLVSTPAFAQQSTSTRVECPVCGGKAEPGEIICNFCGARLDASAPPPPEPRTATSSGSLRFPTGQPTGTARVEHPSPDDRPGDEREEPAGSRRWIGIIGYTIAALIALIG